MNDRRPAARPGRIRGGPATRRKHQAIIEPQAVNDRLLEVCAHYAAAPGATAGRRTTWACPRCAKAKFEALPERGLAGCWNAACEVPQTTNALGLIAFFAGLDRRTDFPQILTVAAEILGEGSAATPHANRSPRGGRRPPAPRAPLAPRVRTPTFWTPPTRACSRCAPLATATACSGPRAASRQGP